MSGIQEPLGILCAFSSWEKSLLSRRVKVWPDFAVYVEEMGGWWVVCTCMKHCTYDANWGESYE